MAPDREQNQTGRGKPNNGKPWWRSHINSCVAQQRCRHVALTLLRIQHARKYLFAAHFTVACANLILFSSRVVAVRYGGRRTTHVDGGRIWPVLISRMVREQQRHGGNALRGQPQ